MPAVPRTSVVMPMAIENVGIVGAGEVGSGVAAELAVAGYRPVVLDVSDRALECAKERISIYLRLLLTWQNKNGMERFFRNNIVFSTEPCSLAQVEMVIENTTQTWETKRVVYEMLNRACTPTAIFGVNTSTFPIISFLSLTNRATQILGINFKRPVPMKMRVEIIPGPETAESTIDAAKTLLRSIGKKCIVLNQSRDSLSNRILMVVINEAIYLVQEQAATPEMIDQIFLTLFSGDNGPLRAADLLGLDTLLQSLNDLYQAANDDKYRPSSLLRSMVASGKLGQKSGQGFFKYFGPEPILNSAPDNPEDVTSQPITESMP